MPLTKILELQCNVIHCGSEQMCDVRRLHFITHSETQAVNCAESRDIFHLRLLRLLFFWDVMPLFALAGCWLCASH
jgi:hypothetical protein